MGPIFTEDLDDTAKPGTINNPEEWYDAEDDGN